MGGTQSRQQGLGCCSGLPNVEEVLAYPQIPKADDRFRFDFKQKTTVGKYGQIIYPCFEIVQHSTGPQAHGHEPVPRSVHFFKYNGSNPRQEAAIIARNDLWIRIGLDPQFRNLIRAVGRDQDKTNNVDTLVLEDEQLPTLESKLVNGRLEDHLVHGCLWKLVSLFNSLHGMGIFHGSLQLSDFLWRSGEPVLKELPLSSVQLSNTEGEVSKKDIFDLGCILYVLVHGNSQLKSSDIPTQGNYFQHHRQLVFPNSVYVNPVLKEALKHMIRSDPNDRITWSELVTMGSLSQPLNLVVFERVRDYSLIKKLGQGSFASVWLAYTPDMLEVVVKVYDLLTTWSSSTQISNQILIQNEIQALKSANTPFVVRLRDSFVETEMSANGLAEMEAAHSNTTTSNYRKHRYYVVLEYCSEGTLGSLLHKQREPFDEVVVRSWFKDLLDGFLELQQVPKCSIFGRDIKLENILLRDNKPVIADLGMCKKGAKARFTEKGSSVYEAPEALQMNMQTHKTDVWSLGVTLYMLLFGRDPWNKWDAIEKTALFGYTDEVSAPHHTVIFPRTKHGDITKELQALLTNMLSFDPSTRRDMRDLKRDRYFDESRQSTEFLPYDPDKCRECGKKSDPNRASTDTQPYN